MKNRVYALVFCALAALLVFAGCNKGPEDKIAGFMDEYTDIIVKNADDCSAAGKKLDKLVSDKGKDFVDALTAVIKESKGDKDSDVMKKLEDRMKGKDDKKLEEATEKCKDNSDFQAAQMKFGLMLLPALMGSMGDIK